MRIIRLAADPINPDEIYAGQEVGGVIRRLDGGETWNDCSKDLLRLGQMEHLKSQIGSDTDVEGIMDTHALAVSSARPGTVFLATRMGLFRSANRGETWDDMEVGRFSSWTYARDVQVSPHDPNVLYACLSTEARGDYGTVYRSQDLGETWKRLDHGVTPRSTMWMCAFNREDPRQVYCVTRDDQLFATQDDGATWAEYPLPEDAKGIIRGLAVG